MTYTFKLSRRLALSHISWMVPLLSLALACTSGELPTTAESDPTLSGEDLSFKPGRVPRGRKAPTLRIAPDTATLLPAGQRTFSAILRASDGSTRTDRLVWTATGGTIDSLGGFTAGAVPGHYRVTAVGVTTGTADTATVSVVTELPAPPPPPPLQRVVLTPVSVTLAAGASQQFAATGTFGDSSTSPITVVYTATGGTITPAGLYTAGSVAGTYHAIATEAGGLADTATLVLTAPPPATLTRLVIAPGTANLATGATLQFTASATWSDSAAHPLTVAWTATGGTITQAGLYTTGTVAGSYRVVAAASGRADTTELSVTAPPPPPPPAPGYAGCPAGAVSLATTDDWAAKAAAAPTGTVFCAATGIHLKARNIVPRTGQQFIAATKRGAVLDGASVAPYAFQTLNAAPASVVLRGLVIRNYNPPTQQGAIFGSNGDGWTIEDSEIDHNGYYGLQPGTRFLVRRNYIHHNRISGMDLWHAHGTMIEDDTLTFNPATVISETGATSEAAQIKVGYSDNVTVRNNYITDGQHKAIWFDYMNRGVLIEGNTILRQGQAGIWHEVSYDAVITGNTITTCGTRGSSWIDGAGIQVTNSPNVEISGNTISGCANGIGIMMASGYTNGPYGRNYVANLNVHDNTVTMATGRTGIVQNYGNDSVFTSWNNRFSANHYILSPTAPFAWANGNRTETQWRGYGQDVSSTFDR